MTANTSKEVSLKKQSFALFFGKTTAFAIQILSPIILVRLISQSDYGLYQKFILLGNTFVPILGMGLTSSLYYFYPVSNMDGKDKVIQQTFANLFIIGLLFVVLFYYLNFPKLEWLNLDELNIHKLSISIYVFFLLTSSLIDVIFTLEKAVSYNKYYYPLENVTRLLLLIAFVLFYKTSTAPLYALSIFSAVRFLFLLVYIRKYVKKFRMFNYSIFRDQMLYSLPFGASILLNTLGKRIDKFIVSGYISQEEFAVYSVAFFSIPLLTQLFASIHDVVMPEIAKLCEISDKANVALLWKNTINKTASIAIPAVLFFYVLSNEVIEILYTKAYIEAAKYYRLYILFLLFSMFSQGLVLRGFKKTNYLFLSDLIGAVITVSVSFVLIKEYGIYGAVITALIGIVLPIVFKVILEIKMLELSWSQWVDWKTMSKIIIISLIPLLFIIGLKDRLDNIYFRSLICAAYYLSIITFLQVKYRVFIYPEIIPKIKKIISMKMD